MKRHDRPRPLSTLLILIAAAALVSGCADRDPQPAVTGDLDIDTLVTAQWLSDHLDDPDLVVLDCSVRVEPEEGGGFKPVSGRENYDGGHIPSAGFADLLGDLSDPESELLFAAPTPEKFCAAMGALGVGDESRVVLYDASNSAWAARVWWMLRWVGFDRAAVLDGGLKAWTAEGRPLSTDPADLPARQLTPAPRPELFADQDEVRAAIEDESAWIIDALPEAHFRGDMVGYGRPGHIPGATNIPVSALFDETGRYRALDKLATIHPGDHGTRAIIYCGGGIAASANAFVMTRLGFTDVAVYDASLQEWAADEENPMELPAAHH